MRKWGGLTCEDSVKYETICNKCNSGYWGVIVHKRDGRVEWQTSPDHLDHRMVDTGINGGDSDSDGTHGNDDDTHPGQEHM